MRNNRIPWPCSVDVGYNMLYEWPLFDDAYERMTWGLPQMERASYSAALVGECYR